MNIIGIYILSKNRIFFFENMWRILQLLFQQSGLQKYQTKAVSVVLFSNSSWEDLVQLVMARASSCDVNDLRATWYVVDPRTWPNYGKMGGKGGLL